MSKNSNVVFKNRQWIVDDNGLDTTPEANHNYFIAKNRLVTLDIINYGRRSQPVYLWLPHMLGKADLNFDEFAPAYLWALKHFEAEGVFTVDEDILTRTIAVTAKIQLATFLCMAERMRMKRLGEGIKAVTTNELFGSEANLTAIVKIKYPDFARFL